jgi:hypothetical protein
MLMLIKLFINKFTQYIKHNILKIFKKYIFMYVNKMLKFDFIFFKLIKKQIFN